MAFSLLLLNMTFSCLSNNSNPLAINDIIHPIMQKKESKRHNKDNIIIVCKEEKQKQIKRLYQNPLSHLAYIPLLPITFIKLTTRRMLKRQKNQIVMGMSSVSDMKHATRTFSAHLTSTVGQQQQ